MPSFVTPSGDVLREAAWSEEDRSAALEPRAPKKIADTKATTIAKEWYNGQDSALYLFVKTGGEIKSENIYRRMKSEVSDALRMVINNVNYTPKDADDLHRLMGHVRALGQELEFEGVKKGQTSGYYYPTSSCCDSSMKYPY